MRAITTYYREAHKAKLILQAVSVGFIEEVNKFAEAISLGRYLRILLSVFFEPVLLVVCQALLETFLEVNREVVTGGKLAEDLANLHDEPGAQDDISVGLASIGCCKTGVDV